MTENNRSYDSDGDSQTATSSCSSSTSSSEGDKSRWSEAAGACNAGQLGNPAPCNNDSSALQSDDFVMELSTSSSETMDSIDVAMRHLGETPMNALDEGDAARDSKRSSNQPMLYSCTTRAPLTGDSRKKHPLSAPSTEQEEQGEAPINASQFEPSVDAVEASLNRETASHVTAGTHCYPLPVTTIEDIDINTNTNNGSSQNDEFRVGDHVYQWCSLLGIPGVFQHHGIVTKVETQEKNPKKVQQSTKEENGDQDEVVLTIADFSNLLPSNKNSESKEENSSESPRPMSGSLACGRGSLFPSSSSGAESASSKSFCSEKDGSLSNIISKQGCLRVYKSTSTQQHPWHKVQYEANWFCTLWKRSGTCTPVSSDPPEVVLQRVHFLLNNDSDATKLLPPYHALFANCEAVAVWCKTGEWCTLQTTSFLSHAVAGHAKGAATVASYAAAQTVTVPAGGLYGWFGYTTTVSLVSVQPLLLPAIATVGVVSVGTPALMCAVAKRKWRKITDYLNQAFQQHVGGINHRT